MGWTKLDGTATPSACEIPHNNDENHMPERSPANLVTRSPSVLTEPNGYTDFPMRCSRLPELRPHTGANPDRRDFPRVQRGDCSL